MPNRVPAIRYTAARRSSMRTSSSSDGVSRRTLMGFPSYARNRACALPSPPPFHYVMAKIVPVVQLAAHAKSSTLYGRTVVRSYGRTTKFFRLDGLLLFCIVMGLRSASSSIINTRQSENFTEFPPRDSLKPLKNIESQTVPFVLICYQCSRVKTHCF